MNASSLIDVMVSSHPGTVTMPWPMARKQLEPTFPPEAIEAARKALDAGNGWSGEADDVTVTLRRHRSAQ
jgi:hypothetical protein